MKYIFTLDDEFTHETFCIGVQAVQDSGCKSPMRYISINQFMSAVSPLHQTSDGSKSLEGYSNEVRIPFLPNGTIGYSSKMLDTGFVHERISVVVDKAITGIRYRNMSMTNGQIHFLGFPKLLFQFVLSSLPGNETRTLIDSKVFALKDNSPIVNEDTELYIFPFTNVNKSDHGICWGANLNLTIPSLAHLHNLINLFITSDFNEDYGLMIDRTGKLNFLGYINEFADKPFNDDLLIPAKRTVKDTFGHNVLNFNTKVIVQEEK